MMKDIKGVIFDMDGVIFDSEKEVLYAWREVAKRHRVEGIEEACLKCLGCNYEKSLQIMKEHFGEDFPYAEYKAEVSAIFHERNDGGRLPLKKGVRELLELLRDNRIPVALASSTKRATVVQELMDAGLYDSFDVILGGDMVENSKPAPDIFLMTAETLGLKPENCMVIEDSFNGIRAAASAGMYPVMVPDLVLPDDEIRGLAAGVYTSLDELSVFFF